ncbi:hypothetical protein AAVH_27927 [Aphelenchoides avenae]|nr:hypothetical protein AAVH_27927 [Aphelenchus avenae]
MAAAVYALLAIFLCALILLALLVQMCASDEDPEPPLDNAAPWRKHRPMNVVSPESDQQVSFIDYRQPVYYGVPHVASHMPQFSDNAHRITTC